MKKILLLPLILIPLAGCNLDVPNAQAGTTTQGEVFITMGRSGIYLFTDPLTNCQYILSANGGIIPRMDPAGKQICQPSS